MEMATLLAVSGTVTLAASPAFASAAAYNDSFTSRTTNGGCGSVEFVDYGTWPSGAAHDDYAVVHDLCSDGRGVKAYAWYNGSYVGSSFNGNGLAGVPVYWDPFPNIVAGDVVALKVCLSNGPNDPNPYSCGSVTATSVDG